MTTRIDLFWRFKGTMASDLSFRAAGPYQGRIMLDTFRQSVMVDGAPLTDEIVIEMVRQMEASVMIRWAEAHVHSALVSLATRNARSSLTTWLDSLVWDGKKRLRTFFADTYGA